VRRVALPSGVGGALFLDAMPGRGEPLAQSWRALEAAQRAVEAAGSSPMTPEQDDLVAWYASRSTRA